MTRFVRSAALAAALALLGAAAAQESPPNPLARPPAWAGAWKGEQVGLELRSEGGVARGELSVGGQAYPLEARPRADAPTRLEGSFKAGGADFACALELQGDVLVLTSDGATHRLERVRPATPPNPLAKPPAPNPLGTPPPPGPGGPGQGGLGQAPAGGPLADAWAGPAERRTNAGGAWSCEIPAGYSVANEAGSGLLINPGVAMQPGTVPEALVACEVGELSPAEAQQSAQQLLRSVIPNLQQMLQGQGISVPRPSEPVDVQVGGMPGGVYQWDGQGANQAAFTVWMGVVVRAPRYVLVLGVVQKGKEAAYLPKIKRLFASAQLAAGGGSMPGGGQGPQPGPGMGGMGGDEGADPGDEGD